MKLSDILNVMDNTQLVDIYCNNHYISTIESRDALECLNPVLLDMEVENVSPCKVDCNRIRVYIITN